MFQPMKLQGLSRLTLEAYNTQMDFLDKRKQEVLEGLWGTLEYLLELDTGTMKDFRVVALDSGLWLFDPSTHAIEGGGLVERDIIQPS